MALVAPYRSQGAFAGRPATRAEIADPPTRQRAHRPAPPRLARRQAHRPWRRWPRPPPPDRRPRYRARSRPLPAGRRAESYFPHHLSLPVRAKRVPVGDASVVGRCGPLGAAIGGQRPLHRKESIMGIQHAITASSPFSSWPFRRAPPRRRRPGRSSSRGSSSVRKRKTSQSKSRKPAKRRKPKRKPSSKAVSTPSRKGTSTNSPKTRPTANRLSPPTGPDRLRPRR